MAYGIDNNSRMVFTAYGAELVKLEIDRSQIDSVKPPDDGMNDGPLRFDVDSFGIMYMLYQMPWNP